MHKEGGDKVGLKQYACDYSLPYYAMEDDVTNAGAIYSRDPVVVDGNIVTSPHYDFMGPWLKTAINMVKNA